ncbi:RNA 2',3'-cyclic phosphodiesterase [Virgisporangium ochraceum]|uniref:RNA 2',3'-cyclic phosphodiesterase n=1 Tax=Virgisporangium ochraceum TaxID=65505 RepID=A0A8J3ZPM5_9ACTN|nr:RNA 2',3'-cyclic phosphodiesterase [Virgisporangium ochraceum]GIJ65588.1 RNA 2',3'-cyclic phosphodiesterase [Virgisporangium ochraceum]
MRLFVAAYPPPAVLDDFVSHVSTLACGAPRPEGESLRLVPPDRVHLTLTFIGEVPDERLPRVEAAVAAGVGSGPRKVPRLRIGGGGRFGRGKFTVMWAGLRGDTTALNDLVSDLRRAMRSARVPFDVKAYRPHVTVARPGDRLPEEQVAADLAALSTYEGPEWPVESIDLVCSNQGPSITYDRLSSYQLR